LNSRDGNFGETVGIMADSHGRPETIKSALEFLSHRGCSKIYHLGDICDSLHPETARECADMLSKNGVLAIKGNNEHALVVRKEMNPELKVSVWTAEYFKNLKPLLKHEYAIFAHSLPFVRELGVSCMMRNMDNDAIDAFFHRYSENVLFRGHSHAAEIIRKGKKRNAFYNISEGEEIDLKGKMPCIITCGALTRGMCMLWKPQEMKVSCLSFCVKGG
jgi:predicted phosphodiesterase